MLCLMPDYLEKFVCDGQRCGAQCCRLWTVFVDGGTYEKYRGLPQEKSREIMARLMPGEEGQAPWAWDFGPEQVCHFLSGILGGVLFLFHIGFGFLHPALRGFALASLRAGFFNAHLFFV